MVPGLTRSLVPIVSGEPAPCRPRPGRSTVTGGLELLVGVLAVAVAGLVQRLGGMGFALVAGPVLLTVAGPEEAVKIVLLTATGASVATLAATCSEFRSREVLPVALVAVLAVWPTAVVAELLQPDVASIVAGVTLLAALFVTVRPISPGAVPRPDTRAPPPRGRDAWSVMVPVTGVLSGAMNSVAALGGPLVAAYGLRQGWRRSMVPNLAAYLTVTSVAVLLVRGLPTHTRPGQLILLVGVAIASVVVGGLLARRLSPSWTAGFTVAVASFGAVAAILRGVIGLTTS